MTAPPTSRLLLLLLFALGLRAEGAAAQLEFRGIPWGASPDDARAAIERAGHPFRGQDQDGDHVFGGPDRMDVVAMFDSAGLVYVESTWLDDPDGLPARFERLGDSLRASLGAPDTANEDEYERFMRWRRDGAELELFFRPRGGGLDTALTVKHYGPGWEAEDLRRAEAWQHRAEGERDTTGVGDWHQAFGGFRVLIRVDTVKYTRLDGQRYLARILHDWTQLYRTPSGLMYSAAVADLELDCGRMRTRLHRRVFLYDTDALPDPEVIPEAERQWSRPVAGSPDDVAIREACTALGRQP